MQRREEQAGEHDHQAAEACRAVTRSTRNGKPMFHVQGHAAATAFLMSTIAG
jgi:hypothetical protein